MLSSAFSFCLIKFLFVDLFCSFSQCKGFDEVSNGKKMEARGEAGRGELGEEKRQYK